ncbi:hypothetical protein ACWGH8_37450 [Nonomuraea muscovyensis]
MPSSFDVEEPVATANVDGMVIELGGEEGGESAARKRFDISPPRGRAD